jgi:hypothetical protein
VRRLIRVHLGTEPTFVIESFDGVVWRTTRGFEAREISDHEHGWVGKSELVVAASLAASGALFVDLLNETVTIQPRRRYVPREQPKAKVAANRAHDDRPVVRSTRNYTLESLREYRSILDVELPREDIPF